MCSPDRHDGSCTTCETDTWLTAADLRVEFREPLTLPRDGGESETNR